ncbi:carbon-nitrogen hydrolase family protein [Streptomyces sp. SID13031]|uniref:carbon-nitrogen hydrolase family protein n=1 Tax=Streptomyces sp. SID13031 TaxID=2706046 RepID=UPI0031BAD1B1
MLKIGAVAAGFTRDLEFDLARVEQLIRHGRREEVQLLVLPDAALGGYLSDLSRSEHDDLPPALELDDPLIAKVIAMAGEMVVCFGFCEAADGNRYNTALCVTGDGVLGRHRKVHQPPGERAVYSAGDRFEAFDTPIGRLGLMIDYDKTFPESARALAVDGAELIGCLNAWPTSITNRAPRMNEDRQSRLFDLYDRSRAAENQVFLVSSNLTGSIGGMRFLGQSKVVGPGGDIVARTWSKAGIAIASVDVRAEIETARRVLHHLDERRPEAY